MADLTVTGSMYITGIFWMVGGAGTFVQYPEMTAVNVALMVMGWGLSQQGRTWFNGDTKQWEGWNGTTRVILG